MLDHLKRWWAVYGTVVLTITIAELELLKQTVSKNPTASLVIAGLLVALGILAKSPTKQ